MSTSHEAEAPAEPLELVESFDKAVERLREVSRIVQTTPYDRNIAAVSYNAEGLRRAADALFRQRLLQDTEDYMLISAAVGTITNSSEDLAYLGNEILPTDTGYEFFPDEIRERLLEAIYSNDPSVFYREDYDEAEDDEEMDDDIMISVLLNKFQIAYEEMVNKFESAVLESVSIRHRKKETKTQLKIIGAAIFAAAATSAASHLMKDRKQ